MLTIGWRSWSLMLMVAGVVGLTGCSSGGDTAVTPATPTTSAAQASAGHSTTAEVAAGLRKIEQLAKQIAATAGTDKAKATSLDGEIEPAWKPIEDTVKQNDQNTYLAMEDSFAVLEKAADDGDAAAAEKGSAVVTSAVQAYLAKYSG